jgi:GT2 family glycosyltransferase
MEAQERDSMTSRPKISIVILNWNGSGFLKRFLPSVVAHSAVIADIVVADNGSSDDSRILVETLFPSVIYLQLDQNFGFAAGYNKALQLIQNEFFVLLNSDVDVTDGS